MKTMVVYMSISRNNTEKVVKVLADTLSADLKKAEDFAGTLRKKMTT